MSIRPLYGYVMRRFNPWVFSWVFFGVLVITSIWAHLQPRVYESTGVLIRLQTGPVMTINAHKAAKMRTQLTESIPTLDMIDFEAVFRRLTAADIADLLKPYGHGSDAGIALVTDVLRQNVSITPIRLSLVFKISYRHPDPSVAFKVSEAFVDEWFAQYVQVRAVEVANYIEELGELRDAEMKRHAREQERINQAMNSARKSIQGASDEARMMTNAYIEQLNQEIYRNEEWLKTINLRFERQAAEARELPLRIVDRPRLPHPDQYVRTPLMNILRWRLMISIVVGLLVAVWVNRRNLPLNGGHDNLLTTS